MTYTGSNKLPMHHQVVRAFVGDGVDGTPLKTKTATKSITVDLVVYGAGPDVETMQAKFVDEIADTGKGDEAPMALEPVIDQDRHYNQQIEVRDPALLMEMLGPKVSPEKGKADPKARLGKVKKDPEPAPQQETPKAIDLLYFVDKDGLFAAAGYDPRDSLRTLVKAPGGGALSGPCGV